MALCQAGLPARLKKCDGQSERFVRLIQCVLPAQRTLLLASNSVKGETIGNLKYRR
jgi:hypothetical protein